MDGHKVPRFAIFNASLTVCFLDMYTGAHGVL